ncbi:MAG: L,D-transpeptidase family protein [Alphaproteobacteria bacterium]|nr:L,D-transpeptidase family protein [Alphaproteobacteria bacterium]
MDAKLRFNIVAIVLSCVVCAGTTLALVSIDTRPGPTATVVRQAEELRPTLVALPEPVVVPRPQAVIRPSRFSFFDNDVGELNLPEEALAAAATAESWSVEVKEQPVTAPKRKTSAAKSPTKRSRKSTKKRYSLEERLAEISPAARGRLAARFAKAKAAWPPAEVAYVAIKDQRALEVYARVENGEWIFVHSYKVLAASGRTGPKLLRGDKQVPEGVYSISYLNPNSAFHVSMRVNYPNAFDRSKAKMDGRKDLGGDIMIHGKNASAGCLAMGDPAAEELFVLAAEVDRKNVKVVIAPTDFRKPQKVSFTNGPSWTPELYSEIASAMSEFKRPPEASLLTLLGF